VALGPIPPFLAAQTVAGASNPPGGFKTYLSIDKVSPEGGTEKALFFWQNHVIVLSRKRAGKACWVSLLAPGLKEASP